jgi:hypothetical protein
VSQAPTARSRVPARWAAPTPPATDAPECTGR